MAESDDADIELMAKTIDVNTLSLGDPIRLLNIRQKNSGLLSGDNVVITNSLVFTEAPNQSKILICWSPNNEGTYTFAVKDKLLQPLWDKSVTKPIQKNTTIYANCVDNNGSVYVSYRAYERNNSEVTSGVLVYTASGEEKNIDIAVGESHAHSLFLLPSTKKDIVFIGGMLTEGDGKPSTKVFYQEINTADYKLNAPSVTTFSDTLVKQLASQGWGYTRNRIYGIFSSGFFAF